MNCRLVSVVHASLLFYSVTASAQAIDEPRDFNIERFALSSNRDGMLGVETGHISTPGDYDLHLWLGTENDPLVIYQDENGNRERASSLIRQRSGGQFGGSYIVAPWLQLSLDANVVVQQSRNRSVAGVDEPLTALAQYGFGDLRLAAKFRLLDQRRAGFDVALVPTLEIPTGRGKEYLGAKRGAFSAMVVVSQRIGRLRWAGNAGYLARRQTQVGDLRVDDELQLRVAAGYAFTARLGAAISISAATAANSFVGEFGRNHLETIAGPTLNVGDHWQVLAAGGLGLGAGYGTPDWRLLAGLRYSRIAGIARDVDGDGLIQNDGCPRAAEDLDGYQDSDGCPDFDNDSDGILDISDTAPLEPEDKDGFEDNDGSPDPDNDRDGLADGSDQCPNEAETKNSFRDDDGCPDVGDQDSDGIADDADKCKDLAEDQDKFEDTDGCPDTDNDRDGIVDQKDRCPIQSGPVENYGCPDSDEDTDGVVYRVDVCPNEVGTKEYEGCKTKQKVTLKGGKLIVLEPVFFKTNKAIIQQVSFALLDNVARVLQDHGEFRVQIQGHTDSQGDNVKNKDLSARRAEAVLAYLTIKGIPVGRLESAGFGEDQPVLDNRTAKGRAANRRVAFVILSIDGFDVRGAVQTKVP